MKILTLVEKVRAKRGVMARSSWPAATICAILTAGGAFFLYAFENHDGNGEPFAWFDGASAWPSIAIYLFATLLSIHFLIKTNSDLKYNATELTDEFKLELTEEPKLELTKEFELRDASREAASFFGWKAPPWKEVITSATDTFAARQVSTDEKIDIVTLWQRYLRRGRLWMRLGRAAPMTLFYITGLSFVLRLIGPFPPPSIRGHFCFTYLILPAIVAFVLLTFVVIDAILLNEGFLEQLSEKKTYWPDATFESYGYSVKPNRPDTENDLADYWDILLIAKRTEAVGNRIYYPFVVLSLLIVARLGYFDNWSWPPALIVALCVHFFLVVFAAWRLPRGAKEYRNSVLERVKRRKRQMLTLEQRTPEAIDTIIEEIQSTHQGAFSYLWEQPAARALLLPSGGIIATLLQYLHH